MSIRRRALDLLFTMCDGGAAVEVVEELVGAVQITPDTCPVKHGQAASACLSVQRAAAVACVIAVAGRASLIGVVVGCCVLRVACR